MCCKQPCSSVGEGARARALSRKSWAQSPDHNTYQALKILLEKKRGLVSSCWGGGIHHHLKTWRHVSEEEQRRFQRALEPIHSLALLQFYPKLIWDVPVKLHGAHHAVMKWLYKTQQLLTTVVNNTGAKKVRQALAYCLCFSCVLKNSCVNFFEMLWKHFSVIECTVTVVVQVISL